MNPRLQTILSGRVGPIVFGVCTCIVGLLWFAVAEFHHSLSVVSAALAVCFCLAAYFVAQRRSVAWMFVIGSISGFVASALWWDMWMNKGSIGTPRILHSIISVDGEWSYDATGFEMFAICSVAITIVTAGCWRMIRRRAEQIASSNHY